MIKPPKLRVRIGEFYRDRSGRLYCVVQIFRTKAQSNIWMHVLEERASLEDPSTLLSAACSVVQGSDSKQGVGVLWEPVTCWQEAMQEDSQAGRYQHGDSICVDWQTLKTFKRVSSGEVEARSPGWMFDNEGELL